MKNRTAGAARIALVLVFTVSLGASAFASGPAKGKDCPAPWLGARTFGAPRGGVAPVCAQTSQLRCLYTPLGSGYFQPQIRSGYFPEKAGAPFKGNIVYLEGLGDSMLNHAPLFSYLSARGYRVIAFDYMGQGGSSGKMNNTVVGDLPDLALNMLARHGRDVAHFKKIFMGWSTGGLASYVAAVEKKVDVVVLIAPGVVPNKVVGEGLAGWPPNEITMRTLTRMNYDGSVANPHLDPIHPTSPLEVPGFAVSLLSTAEIYQRMNVPAEVKGLVMLSGNTDTYVDAEKTRQVIGEKASHFVIQQYAGTLHEIDNEIDSVKVHQAIYDFLSGLKE